MMNKTINLLKDMEERIESAVQSGLSKMAVTPQDLTLIKQSIKEIQDEQNKFQNMYKGIEELMNKYSSSKKE